jgi:hypothetical protein
VEAENGASGFVKKTTKLYSISTAAYRRRAKGKLKC